MRRVTNHCDAQTEFSEWTSLQPFHGGDVVTWFDVVSCKVRWSNVVGCEVTWGEVMCLLARCHVMSCNVVSCHFDVMWFLVLCYVTWCNVMSCDVFSCDERHLLWSDAVHWDAITWVCDEMWLFFFGLFAFLNLRKSEVSQLNFLW